MRTVNESIHRLKRDVAAVRARGRDELVTLLSKEYCDLLESLLTLVEEEVALFTHDNLFVIWMCLAHSTNPAAQDLAPKVKEMVDKRVERGLL